MKKWLALIAAGVFLPSVLVLYITVELLLDAKDTELDRSFRDLQTLYDQVDKLYYDDFNRPQEFEDLVQLQFQPENASKIRQQNGAGGEEDKVRKWMMREASGLVGDVKEGAGDMHAVVYPPFVDAVDPSGPGDLGQPVHVNASQLQEEEKAVYDEGWKRNSFNQYVSDRISVHRSLLHGWSPECKEAAAKFPSDLPQASVIIIFHNEAWSILLRSVHSVLSRTPQHLLREVILVDDNSTFDHLKKPLDHYWRRDPRVHIIHAAKREGLTRARLLGYEIAKAPVLVFFDSHIECFPGWYEPLAERIVSNPNITVFPTIEMIDPDTLQVVPNHFVDNVGVFRWRDLTFQWHAVPKDYRARITSAAQPLRSPTMPGGLFAISREFFTILGTYDPGLDYWGGENIEISFKAWMCYGSVELVPCSHVGHIFRRSNPIPWPTNVGLKNVARVAAVWMDDYQNYFLERNLYNVGDYGDVSERQTLRERLGCRNFDWYMRNVRPLHIPPMHVQHAGELKSTGANLCVDSHAPGGDRPKLYGCHGQGGNQFWYVSSEGEIFQDEKRVCERDGQVMLVEGCHDTWSITQDNQLLHSRTGLCLQGGRESDPGQPDLSVTLEQCERDNKHQVFTILARRTDIRFPYIKSV